MSMYENLVMQTQMNYSRYYGTYAAGKTPVRLSDREPLPYEKQIEKLIEKIKEADCIVVGGASGLSSAGGGDFYYEDTPSFRRYFGKFAEKYGFQGAFAGMGYPYKTRGEFWAYLATFLFLKFYLYYTHSVWYYCICNQQILKSVSIREKDSYKNKQIVVFWLTKSSDNYLFVL